MSGQELQSTDGLHPTVSIIVPVFNQGPSFRHTLECLLHQDYPRGSYELIVVDNGSTDGWLDQLDPRREFLVLSEQAVRSSYAARNLGLRHAQGEIVAFTDSDCAPEPNWLAAGVAAMLEARADLAGGSIRFVLKESSAAELYDSIVHMQNDDLAAHGCSCTANLFARRELFARFGPFPVVRSGGDLQWSKRVTASGCKLVFVPDAVVLHPARGLRELVRKRVRVGQGFAGTHQSGHRFWAVTRACLLSLVPPFPGFVWVGLRRRQPTRVAAWPLVWLVSYCANLAFALGVGLSAKERLLGSRQVSSRSAS